jgi:hypothetical protein
MKLQSKIGARSGISQSLVQKRARIRWFRALRLILSEKRISRITQTAEKRYRALNPPKDLPKFTL